MPPSPTHETWMKQALRLAKRAYGQTSPNPLVGAVLVKREAVIGQGWHHKAGQPHAEIEALANARKRGHDPRGATIYVTLEPCCTHGRTPPCTDALISAGIKNTVVAAVDPNPAHAGKGLKILREAGIEVVDGILAAESAQMNETFNHWIVRRTPFVYVKAAMSLDGKIATVTGESKWITGEKARDYGMNLRRGSDAILVGLNTVRNDNPSLTIRDCDGSTRPMRRIVMDPLAETPLHLKVVSDDFASYTTVVVTKSAPERRATALSKHVNVIVAPERKGKIDLRWLLKELGSRNVTSLLVEGGGETNAEFLLNGLAQRIVFFYAPLIIGGRTAPKGVAGDGIASLADKLALDEVEWKKLGPDLLLTAKVRNDSVSNHRAGIAGGVAEKGPA